MKKITFIAIVLMLSVLNMNAQTSSDSLNKPVKNLSVELMGPSNMLGIHFDSRFKANKGFGYSVGLAWAYLSSDNFINDINHFNIVSFVPRLNYLIGRKNKKLEFGVGANLSLVFGRYEYDSYNLVQQPDNSYKLVFDKHIKENRSFGFYYLFTNIGYRRQAPHGFMFRAGISPIFGFSESHSVKKVFVFPYLGFGKSF